MKLITPDKIKELNDEFLSITKENGRVGAKYTEFNKKLINHVPLAIPMNYIMNNEVRDYDYTYTEIDLAEVPLGWRQLMVPLFCELQNEIISNNIEDVYILQVKEKYNDLRVYLSKGYDCLEAIVKKYSDLCSKTCWYCGEKADYVLTNGWIESMCNNCIKEEYLKENNFLSRNDYSQISLNEFLEKTKAIKIE